MIKHVESCPYDVAHGQVRTYPSLPVCFCYCTLIVFAEFTLSGSFAAKYIVLVFIFTQSIGADSIVAKSFLQGPL